MKTSELYILVLPVLTLVSSTVDFFHHFHICNSSPHAWQEERLVQGPLGAQQGGPGFYWRHLVFSEII